MNTETHTGRRVVVKKKSKAGHKILLNTLLGLILINVIFLKKYSEVSWLVHEGLLFNACVPMHSCSCIAKTVFIDYH